VIEFLLSEADGILSAGPGWDAFARANAAPGAAACHWIGRPLWDAVLGSPTRRRLRSVLEECRQSGNTTGLVWRCDSPTEERLYAQRFQPLEAGRVQVTCRLVRQRPHPLTGPSLPRAAEGAAVRCSHCLGLWLAEGWWAMAGPRPPSVPGPVVWGLCPTCRRGAVFRCDPAATDAAPA
jgi:hypothetical protein